ncbi:phosphoenolpyruvate synthase, partial [Acidithiobacillus ferrivorans]|nr:phosphoenolpyruvate synthase [Acidithiobacillus ferrivorans]
MSGRYIRFFKDIRIEDVPLVGGKNASLGEMYRELSPQGVKVPNGFAITGEAYRYLLDQADAWPALHAALDGLDPTNVTDLAERGARAREIIYSAPLPADLQTEILTAYAELRTEYGEALSVAVRSSATAEDLPTASFAGQQDTYLNISGEAALLDACRRCFASLFTDRAIHYRVNQGFDHFKVALSVAIMKMVRSDKATSGVMFSLDTETGFRDVVFITASWGLGENVVQGAVDPDEFYVFKPAFLRGKKAVLRRVLGSKKIKMIYTEGDTRHSTRNVATHRHEQESFCLSDADVLTLADYAIKVEQHYSQKMHASRPMDMEWAKDGTDGQLYMVQARPETVASQKQGQVLEEYILNDQGTVLVQGRAVGGKIASGPVHIISDVKHLAAFKPGEILVAETTTPDWEPIMKEAAAIVTNRGGRTCHAAIIAREL